MAKTIQCKFTCVSVTKRTGWGEFPFVYDAEFNPVNANSYRGRVFGGREASDAAKAEDEEFYAATPGGKLSVLTVAADHFEVGRDYYLNLVPVEQ